MRSLQVSRLLFVILSVATIRPAYAYMGSQEHQWEMDINEAKARAKDFDRYLERRERQDDERDIAADEIKRERERDDERQERERLAYIKYRDEHPSDESIQLRLEKENEIEMAREQKQLEELREEYIAGRDRVDMKIEREAYIDPAKEYDVYGAPTVEWQNAHKTPGALKLIIEPPKKP